MLENVPKLGLYNCQSEAMGRRQYCSMFGEVVSVKGRSHNWLGHMLESDTFVIFFRKLTRFSCSFHWPTCFYLKRYFFNWGLKEKVGRIHNLVDVCAARDEACYGFGFLLISTGAPPPPVSVTQWPAHILCSRRLLYNLCCPLLVLQTFTPLKVLCTLLSLIRSASHQW